MCYNCTITALADCSGCSCSPGCCRVYIKYPNYLSPGLDGGTLWQCRQESIDSDHTVFTDCNLLCSTLGDPRPAPHPHNGPAISRDQTKPDKGRINLPNRVFGEILADMSLFVQMYLGWKLALVDNFLQKKLSAPPLVNILGIFSIWRNPLSWTSTLINVELSANLYLSVLHQLQPVPEGVQPLLHRAVPQQRLHFDQLDLQ